MAAYSLFSPNPMPLNVHVKPNLNEKEYTRFISLYMFHFYKEAPYLYKMIEIIAKGGASKACILQVKISLDNSDNPA